jgi:hypothetical protein
MIDDLELEKQFNLVFDDLPFGRASTSEEHRKKIKYKIIPGLVEFYKAKYPEKSWATCYREVQDLHIKYIGTQFPNEGITREFDDFVSTQIPVLDENGEFHSCYRRNKPGLPAFRAHIFSKADGEVLVEWFHHSFPVPYGEPDFFQRHQWTIQNLKQLPGETIAEIRLITPLTGKKADIIKKHFTELSDYDQLLELAIAAEFCEKEILLFNYGINDLRALADPLQDWLNTRAMVKLYSKVLAELEQNHSIVPLNTRLIDRLSETEEETKIYFRGSLEQDNAAQMAKLREYFAWFDERIFNEDMNFADKQKQEIYDLAIQIKHLFDFRGSWKTKENKYKIQAALVKLNYLLDHTVASGCNDAKDRDGMLAIEIEATEIEAANKRDKKAATPFEDIKKRVKEQSTSNEVAQYISMPGLDTGIDAKDNYNRKFSGVFKRIYTMRQLSKYERKDRWDALIKKWNGWKDQAYLITRWFYGFVLWIMDSLARRQDPTKDAKAFVRRIILPEPTHTPLPPTEEETPEITATLTAAQTREKYGHHLTAAQIAEKIWASRQDKTPTSTKAEFIPVKPKIH